MDSRIRRYKEAYHKLHGRLPVIRKNGAWLYINDSPTAYRLHHLDKMIDELEMRSSYKTFEVKKSDKEYFEVPVNNEIEYLRKALESKDFKITGLEMMIKSKSNEINELKNEIKRLKQNSVFFSMEDM